MQISICCYLLFTLSCVWLFGTPWTGWTHLLFGTPWTGWTHLLCVSCLAGRFFTTEPPGKPNYYICMLSRFSHAQLFATPWTVVYQAPMSRGFPQARILEWVTVPSYRGSFWPREQTESPELAGRLFTTSITWEAQIIIYRRDKQQDPTV